MVGGQAFVVAGAAAVAGDPGQGPLDDPAAGSVVPRLASAFSSMTAPVVLVLDEASSLLREAGVALGQSEVAELHRRTEGWPAGLYLAALCLRQGGPLAGAAVSFAGDDRLVSQYLESEFLARISARQRVF